MSTQFRSRIKTVINYASNESATGGCCLPDGTKLTDSVTINECNRLNGFFRAGDPITLQCPERGLTGCCCACSYIREQEGDFDNFLSTVIGNGPSDSTEYHAQPEGENLNVYGYKDNVTQCECYTRQGKWFFGKCNEVSDTVNLCGSVENQTDIRVPASCCHGTTTDDVQCDNVCTSKECSDFTAATGGISIYSGTEVGGNGSLCDYDYIEPPRLCGAAANNPQERSYSNEQEYNPVRQARNRKYPCFELTTNNSVLEYNCSQKTPDECYESKGYQYPSDATVVDDQYSRVSDNFYSCSDVSSLMYPPLRGQGSLRVTPPTIPSNSTLPSLGDHYQGGIFMGTFMPGSPINPRGSSIKRILGNKLETVQAKGDGSGTNKKRWLLIYSYRPYGLHDVDSQLLPIGGVGDYKKQMNSFSEPPLESPTSFYDGFFNTHGDGGKYGGYNSSLFENIRSMTFNGFNDWYVPSIDELSFLYFQFPLVRSDVYNNVLTNNSIFGSLSLTKELKNTMSSTLYSSNDKLGKPDETSGQIINGRGYVYVQNMNRDANKSKMGLVYKEDRRTKLTVPLVRRIYID
jgi:hypothetical protein